MNELSSLDKLHIDVLNMYEALNALTEYGEISEVLQAALEAQVKTLYKRVIAQVCGISEAEVTDEYIEIAQRTIPTGGYDAEKELFWDGYRFKTDDELREALKPLIERDRKIRKQLKDLLDRIKADRKSQSYNRVTDIINEYGLSTEERRRLVEAYLNAHKTEKKPDVIYTRITDILQVPDLSLEEKRRMVEEFLKTHKPAEKPNYTRITDILNDPNLSLEEKKRIIEEFLKTHKPAEKPNYKRITDILNDPNLSLEEKKRIIEEFLRKHPVKKPIVVYTRVTDILDAPELSSEEKKKLIEDYLKAHPVEVKQPERLSEEKEETPKSRMEVLEEQINAIIARYETEGISEEEKRQLEEKANRISRETIAAIIGVEPEKVPMTFVQLIMHGHMVDYVEGDKRYYQRIPYTDEEVKMLAEMSLKDGVDRFKEAIEEFLNGKRPVQAPDATTPAFEEDDDEDELGAMFEVIEPATEITIDGAYVMK